MCDSMVNRSTVQGKLALNPSVNVIALVDTTNPTEVVDLRHPPSPLFPHVSYRQRFR